MSDIDVFIHFFKRLGAHPAVKLIVGFFLGVLEVLFGTFRPIFAAIMLLFLTDTATGYYHARANPAIKPESRRMYHGLVKLLIYLVLLIIGHQCSLVGLLAVVQGMIESFIVLTESYSVLENVQKICILHHIDLPILDSVMRMVQGRLNPAPQPAPAQKKEVNSNDSDNEGDA